VFIAYTIAVSSSLLWFIRPNEFSNNVDKTSLYIPIFCKATTEKLFAYKLSLKK
jgi:hypothetical protein